MQTFDAIVIGSGQGGTPLAKKLAKAGLKTAIIEKRVVGGTCINDGCTPTKAMIASAKLAYDISQGRALGITSGECIVDLPAIIERKNKIVQSFREGAQKGLEETANLSLVFGEAYFILRDTLTINLAAGGTETFQAPRIFINTGASPSIPHIAGIGSVPYLTSTSILDVTEIPRHLVILGAAYISLEFGQMFRRFGSEVTIIEKAPVFLQKEDEDVSAAMKKILEDEGIRIILSAEVDEIEAAGDQTVSLTVKANAETLHIMGSHLLVAAGRTPQTAALRLDAAGVETDKAGYIRVNEYLETNIPGIYALGDVKGGPAFTHISYNDHLVLLKNTLHQSKVSIKGRPVPYTMFTDPQLARIGLSEKAARKLGLNIQVVTLPMSRVARGIETGQTKGLMKAVVDADSKQILGACVLGAEGGEIMSVLQMAMMGNISYETIRETIFAHPLYSESLNNLFIPLDK